VGEELAWLAERAGARAALPAGVVHGDLFPDNVLFDGERLVALLDFEQASDGAFAYDLAVSLCAWCYADDFVPERARALRAGYEEVRPLEPAERELLWVEARAAATRFTVTRLTDVYLNAAATPLVRATKDFRRYHARLRRLRQLGAAGFAELVGWR
jgi:homoserine kinase type II